MYIQKTIALQWVSATIFAPSFYMHDLENNTFTVRLKPYLNLTELNNKNELNEWTLNLQFTYNISNIDTTNWDVSWLLNYIVNNEASFTGWVIK